MSDQWRRIVIDSRYKTSDSPNNADFYVELPYAVTVPAGSLAYIDNVSMSHSWPTIQENVNDKLYVEELCCVGSGVPTRWAAPDASKGGLGKSIESDWGPNGGGVPCPRHARLQETRDQGGSLLLLFDRNRSR